MVIEYRVATENDAEAIGELILRLTQAIRIKINSNPFSSDFACSASKLRELILNKNYGRESGWSCIELCTPPLPEFERTLNFYQVNGLAPVGGRKMRQYI